MTIKITEQKNVILVRRWKYSPERKRSLPTTIYSVSRYSVPSKLPKDTIKTHEVNAEEQQTFVDFASKLKGEQEKKNAKYSLRYLTENLNKAKDALIDPELKDALTLEQYEDLSETVNEIKKLITKNKNNLKRKAARQQNKKPKLTVEVN